MLVIFNILQFVVFLVFYLIDRTRYGAREWILWSVCLAVGFSLIFARRGVPSWLMRPTVALSNALLYLGHIFLYLGIARFLEIRPWRAYVASVSAFFVFGSAIAMAVLGDGNLSANVLYLSLAGMLVCVGVPLWRDRSKGIRTSARFLSILMFAQAAFLLSRSILAYAGFTNLAFFESSVMQVGLFLAPLCMGYLWSSSIIIMLNHAKVSEYRESRKNQEVIFNTLPDAVWVVDVTDQRIVETNDGFSRLTGYERKEILGKTTDDIGIWKDPEIRKRSIRDALETSLVEDVELDFITKFGKVRTGMISSRKIALGGRATLVNILHDITARNEMENALKSSEEKFRLLVENSYDIIYSLDPRGKFTFVSPVWTRVLGHEVEDVLGKSFKDFVHPDDVGACKDFLAKMVATGERQAGIEYRALHKNGYWLWHTSSAVPFFSEEGAIAGFYGIDRDITERRELQKELEVQATTDELTGVTNRRHFIALASGEIKRAIRMGHDLSFALIDLDRFKDINDTYGHGVGDQALVFFTRIIKDHIRDMDVLSRFGGDEFIILFPETTTDHAIVVIERLRATLASTPFASVEPPILLGASVGVTCLARDSETSESLDTMLFRADKALYRSKDAGRNRYSVI
jgi:diguanylate cyclase (GGDEF)-like protein/PAS domain S-box-containing protein